MNNNKNKHQSSFNLNSSDEYALPVGPNRAFFHKVLSRRFLFLLTYPIFFTISLFYALPLILTYWTDLFNFFIKRLVLTGRVNLIHYHILNHSFFLPSLELNSSIPNHKIWIGTTIGIIVIFLLTRKLRDKYTPFRHAICGILLIQASTILYLLFAPNAFFHNIYTFVKLGLLHSIGFMLLIPWVFTFTYYLSSPYFVKKFLVTLAIIIFLIIATPLQFMLAAYIISKCSILFMPVLYTPFGWLLDILVIIGIYGYGLSLEKLS